MGLGYGDNFLAVLIANSAGEMKRFLDESYPDARDTLVSAYVGRFGQRRQEVFQIGRRGRQHHDVRFADRSVQVVRGGYAFPVEFRVAQIAY